jgi:hypothetical protein
MNKTAFDSSRRKEDCTHKNGRFVSNVKAPDCNCIMAVPEPLRTFPLATRENAWAETRRAGLTMISVIRAHSASAIVNPLHPTLHLTCYSYSGTWNAGRDHNLLRRTMSKEKSSADSRFAKREKKSCLFHIVLSVRKIDGVPKYLRFNYIYKQIHKN